MAKFLVTTSHRPTRNTRRFVKFISMVLPNFTRVNRGKLTLSMIALQAIDMNMDKVVIVRNRKGNPGYIDIYSVDYLDKSLKLLCTLRVCSYNQLIAIESRPFIKPIYKGVVLDLYVEEGLNKDELSKTLECLTNLFPLTIQKTLRGNDICKQDNYLFINIRRNTKNNVYEVEFRDCLMLLGILRICI